MRKIRIITLTMILCLAATVSVSAAEKKMTEERHTKWDVEDVEDTLTYGGGYHLSDIQKKSIKDANKVVELDEPQYIFRENAKYKKMSDEEFAQQLFLLGSTKDFKIYFPANCGELVIRTKDDKYLNIDNFFTNTGLSEKPRFGQADYDNDGESELAISEVMAHGLGLAFYNVTGLFVVDKDSRGRWQVYYLPYNDYMDQVASKIQATYSGNKASFSVKGAKSPVKVNVDAEGKIGQMTYDFGQAVDWIPYEGDIYMVAAPMIFAYEKSTDDSMPLAGEDVGQFLFQKVNYKGDGKFEYGNLVLATREDGPIDVDELEEY